MIFVEQPHSLFLYKFLVWKEWYGDEPAHSIAQKKDKWDGATLLKPNTYIFIGWLGEERGQLEIDLFSGCPS